LGLYPPRRTQVRVLSPLLEGDGVVAFLLESRCMKFFVYVLHSVKHDKIYIGYTSDLQSRIMAHNVLGSKGFTLKFRPWILIYTESFDSKISAMKKRKAIKICQGKRVHPKKFTPSITLGSYPPTGGHRFESCPRYFSIPIRFIFIVFRKDFD
jgi:putative endonuclease